MSSSIQRAVDLLEGEGRVHIEVRWISVKETLPPMRHTPSGIEGEDDYLSSDDVPVVVAGGEIRFASCAKFPDSQIEWCDRETQRAIKPTYWLPLPPIPKGGKKK
ncbi:MAG TPA: hypothetical protein VFA71_03945 [Terriglobales bacterium]|nr:hypothetical protein [Terriglobales bacterium]